MRTGSLFVPEQPRSSSPERSGTPLPQRNTPERNTPVFTTRRSLVATAATVALAGFAALGVAAPASAATVNGAGKVGICKATGSASNPYTFLYAGTDNLISGHFQ